MQNNQNEELEKIIRRQTARLLSTINQVIDPHPAIIDAIKLYVPRIAKDAFIAGKKASTNNVVIKKYEHKRFD